MAPPPPVILDLGPVVVTLPPGYSEDTRFVIDDKHRRIVVTRFDDPAETPDEIADDRHRRAIDLTEGEATPTKREARVIDERPAHLSVYRIKERGVPEDIALLIVQLRQGRYAQVQCNGRGARAVIEDLAATFRVSSKPVEAPPKGFQPSRSFIEFTMCVPEGMERRTPYTFEDADAGIAWRIDAESLAARTFPSLAARVARPPELDASPDVATRTHRGPKCAGPVALAQTIDPEMAAPGPLVCFAQITVEHAVQVRLAGQAPGAQRERFEKDLAMILDSLARTPGGAR
jgi:hypothetical protein